MSSYTIVVLCHILWPVYPTLPLVISMLIDRNYHYTTEDMFRGWIYILQMEL